MNKKSQSVIFQFFESRKIERAIRLETKKFIKECGCEIALSEKLFFQSSCAALIEDLGFIPPTYCGDAAAYMRLQKSGNLPAGWPTAKAMEAH